MQRSQNRNVGKLDCGLNKATIVCVESRTLLMAEPCSALDSISTGKVEVLRARSLAWLTIVIVTCKMQQAALLDRAANERTVADMESLIHTLVGLAAHAQIVHHQPGRIRLKIPWEGLQSVQDLDLEAMVQNLPGVLHHRVNPMARSIVIDYDHHVLPSDLWELLGQVRRQPELKAEVTAHLHALYRERVRA
jgi:hypothetical protein